MMMINGRSARAEKTDQKKNALLPLNDFIKKLQGWIFINNIQKLQELYSAYTQVVCQIIHDNSADTADIYDFSIRHLLQEDTLPSAKNVSAIDISSTTLPKSLKSYPALPVNDKAIWDMAYEEEYYILHNKTKTWTYISEEEYQQLKPAVGNALPTISIAIIFSTPMVSLNSTNTAYLFLVTLTRPTGHTTGSLLQSFTRLNYVYSSPPPFKKYAK